MLCKLQELLLPLLTISAQQWYLIVRIKKQTNKNKKQEKIKQNKAKTKNETRSKVIVAKLKGYCTFNQILPCFQLYLKIINTFFEKWYMHFIENCHRNSKMALKFKLGNLGVLSLDHRQPPRAGHQLAAARLVSGSQGEVLHEGLI